VGAKDRKAIGAKDPRARPYGRSLDSQPRWGLRVLEHGLTTDHYLLSLTLRAPKSNTVSLILLLGGYYPKAYKKGKPK